MECRLFTVRKETDGIKQQMTLDELNMIMNEIVPLDKDDRSLTFSINTTFCKVYPVVVVDPIAVVGVPHEVSNLPEIRSLKRTKTSNSCDLSFEWPTGCDEIVLATHYTRIPTGPKDPEAKIENIKKKTYDVEGLIKLPMKDVSVLYVSIFTVHGDKLSYGYSFEILAGDAPRIGYTVEVKKKSFMKKEETMEIKFSTDIKKAMTLPSMAVVVNNSRMPLSITDGVVVASVSDVSLNGGKASVNASFTGPLVSSNIKIFFRETASYDNFKLIHPVGKR
jgi:hypothetical protein